MFRRNQDDGDNDNDDEIIDWDDDDTDSDGSVYDSSSFVSSADSSNDDDDDDDSSHSESSSSSSSGRSYSSSESSDEDYSDDSENDDDEECILDRPRIRYKRRQNHSPQRWHHEIGAVAGDLVSSLRRRVGSNHNQHGHPHGLQSRQRNASSSAHYIDIHNDNKSHDGHTGSESEGRTKRRKHYFWKRHPYYSTCQTCFHLYYERCPGFFNKIGRISSRISSLILLVSFLIFVHALTARYVFAQSPTSRVYFKDPPPRRGLTPEHADALRKQRKKEAQKALGSAAGGAGTRDMISGAIQNLFSNRKSRKKNKNNLPEGPPSGCKFYKWQTKTYPTCNEIHEVDLMDELHMRHHAYNFLQELDIELGKQITRKTGYVGSGLYRSVFKVDPRREATAVDEHNRIDAPVVLKIMKPTQKFDARNLDRHRRDSLVMEELQGAPNVVTIYGYCGNTLLTEYIPVDLGTLIYNGVDVPRAEASPTDKHQIHTRKTPLGRLHLAWDVARGLAAAHGLHGPVLHADVQAKQFLVHPYYGVKVNDFNRCRLMPESMKNGNYCKVPIPSAPGTSRSPEEYAGEKLTFQIDVYSAAHIFFGILTGEKAWKDYPSTTIKVRAKAGELPPLPHGCCTSESDKALVELMNQAYERDPEKRITASKLAEKLEILIKQFEGSP